MQKRNLSVSLDNIFDKLKEIFTFSPEIHKEFENDINLLQLDSEISNISFNYGLNKSLLNPGTVAHLTFVNCEFEDYLTIVGNTSCLQLEFRNCTFKKGIQLVQTKETEVFFTSCEFLCKTDTIRILNHCNFINIFNSFEKIDSIFVGNDSSRLILRDLTINTLILGEHTRSNENILSYVEISDCTIEHINSNSNVPFYLLINGGKYDKIDMSSAFSSVNIYASENEVYIKNMNIFTTLKLISILDSKIDNLTISEQTEDSKIVLNTLNLTKAKLSISNCHFKNSYFENIDFRETTITVRGSSFAGAHFFNVRWNKEHPVYSKNWHDLLEAFRTLKLSYKNDDNSYYYYFFFSKEQEEVLNNSEELGLSCSDRIILQFNSLSGFGISFLKGFFTLFIYMMIFLGLTNLYIGNSIGVSSDNISGFFQVTAIVLNPLSRFEDPYYKELSPIIILLNKFVIAAFYYQIISSFRKFSRK